MAQHEQTATSSESDLRDTLQSLLLGTEDVENFLQELAELAASAVSGEVHAGVTVSRDGHAMTVASSDSEAAQYDEVQYARGEGPCLTSLRTGETTIIGDLATDDQFPQYRLSALAMGIRSILSLPLDGGDQAVGALNLYSRQSHAFGERELADARRFADEASRALTLAVRLVKHVELTEQLQAAMTSRSVIDQAMGIVMGQNRCSAEEAFAVLRAASQHRNVKLRLVAQEIVTSVTGSAAGDGPRSS
jgi:transcriptional regulator with GAF, ATPase, and Fis domain